MDEIRTIKDIKSINDNYVVIDFKAMSALASSASEMYGSEKSELIRKEIGSVVSKLLQYEMQFTDVDLRKILIRKDSHLGEFILNSSGRKKILGVDAYLSYENIISAYLNASITDNLEMCESLKPLLKSRTEGFVDDFHLQITDEVLYYIFENGNLDAFVKGEEFDIRDFAVFENNAIKRLTFIKRKN